MLKGISILMLPVTSLHGKYVTLVKTVNWVRKLSAYILANNILGVNFKDRNSFDDLKADTLVLPVNRVDQVSTSMHRM